jgi:glycosyltransferase involved in cell wall biosynthesis
MRILFIVPYVPNLIRVRPYNLIRQLAARDHEVTVLTLWSGREERADAEALTEHCHDVVALPLPGYCSLWNCVQALPRLEPLQSVYSWSRSLAHEIDGYLRQPPLVGHPPYDVVHVEHLRAARYGLVARGMQPFGPSCSGENSRRSPRRKPWTRLSRPPVIWDSVDCISHLLEQTAQSSRSVFGRLKTRFDLGRTRQYEGWLVEQFDRVLVTAGTDQRALEALYASRLDHRSASSTPHPSGITVLPNGVDLGYFTPGHEPREPDTLVFTGKMSYHANVTAVLHLVNDIMPHVWSQRRRVRLTIAGKDPPRRVRALAIRHRPLVDVTGTVPDIRPYLRRATAAVVSTPYGAAIQNKVLEAMACETPVVASPQAVSALQVRDGEEVLVANRTSDATQTVGFARRVLQLLEDGALRRKIGRRGREYVEKHHDWRRVAERLEGIYRDAIGEHGSRLGTH